MPSPLPPVAGFRFATAAARIKDWDRDDIALVVADDPVAVAGVFTQSTVAAAPVKRCRAALEKTGGFARALLVNAGVANACTGREGRQQADECARHVARALGARRREVMLASTGVIGRPLPMDKMRAGIDTALSALHADAARPGTAADAKAGMRTRPPKTNPPTPSDTAPFVPGTLDAVARAIMTTDTHPKTAHARVEGSEAVVAGVAKGSGMIAPNMATMLAFLFTDASVDPKVLRTALTEVADLSFNNVTVDGDTSTNDTLLVFASGRAKEGPTITKASGRAYGAFREALASTAFALAEQIARDGEGATKLVRVVVEGAASRPDARHAARTIAESPLVKTAMFGNDPNWGRIVMAIGRSGAKVREERIDIDLCGTSVMAKGAPVPFDAKALSTHMRGEEVLIRVTLGMGKHACTMLTCDYSYDYIKINADYTT